MSSSIDPITCPECGADAFIEQVYGTCEKFAHCPKCGWNDESNDDTVKEVRDPDKVYIVWCWDDVEHLKPDWSPERCQAALDICSKVLTSRSTEEGWQILSDLLSINEDEIEKAVSPE